MPVFTKPSAILSEPVVFPLLVLLAVVWLIPHTSYPNRISQHVAHKYQQIPSLKIDLQPQRTLSNRYSPNKTALYIEPQTEIKHVTPLLLHMMEIVPQEWRFIFVGSNQTIESLSFSQSIIRHVSTGKLVLDYIDKWTRDWEQSWSETSIEESTSRILTEKEFYETRLKGTEHLFVFHSNAVLCANAESDLNEWLEWDWVGAPWNNAARFGGSGGLSLRRVSKVMQVLNFQQRMPNGLQEDAWLSSRMGLLPGANMAPIALQAEFAVEDVWHDRPMGYHINPTGFHPDVWHPLERRQAIYEYCPEIKIILDMRLERERCAPSEPPPPTPQSPNNADSGDGTDGGHVITPEEYNAEMASSPGAAD